MPPPPPTWMSPPFILTIQIMIMMIYWTQVQTNKFLLDPCTCIVVPGDVRSFCHNLTCPHLTVLVCHHCLVRKAWHTVHDNWRQAYQNCNIVVSCWLDLINLSIWNVWHVGLFPQPWWHILVVVAGVTALLKVIEMKSMHLPPRLLMAVFDKCPWNQF